MLQPNLRILPLLFNMVIEGFVSIKRINSFLKAQELQDTEDTHDLEFPIRVSEGTVFQWPVVQPISDKAFTCSLFSCGKKTSKGQGAQESDNKPPYETGKR